MKYVTLPRITLEQRDAFLDALTGISRNYIPAPGVPEVDELIKLLFSGSTRTVTRKGNALDLLPKFASKDDSRPLFAKVHNNDGTHIAVDGHKAAVILPPEAEAWDMSNAYIMDDDGERKDLIQKLFTDCRTLSCSDISFDTLRELLDACKFHKEQHKLAAAERGEKKPGPAYICIEAAEMTVITVEQAEEMFKKGGGCPMQFNADNLELGLKFALCAASGTAEAYYSKSINPLYFHADNLYTVILPIRPKWQLQNGAESA